MNEQEGTPRPETCAPEPGGAEGVAGTESGAAGAAPREGTTRLPGKRKPVFLVLALLFFVAGIAGFVWLFVRDFNIYWLILSPVIIALYQIPAVFLFWLYKRSGGRAA